MTPSELNTELTTGPLATEIAPFITSGDDSKIAEIMNRKDIAAYGEVKCNTFAAWATATGQRIVIEDTSIDTNSPVRAIALSLRDLLFRNDPLNFADPGIVQLAQTWLAVGKMTQANYDALIALAQTTISRTEQLKISISHMDIAKALRG